MAERSDITCPRLLSQPVRLQKTFLSPISSLTLQLAPASNPTQLHPFLKHLSTLLGLEGFLIPQDYAHMLLLSVASPDQPPTAKAEQPLLLWVLSSGHCTTNPVY